jgi:SHS2 domain-containing protein
MKSGFEEVEHTADWAYHVYAQSLPELFVEAAKGLYYLAGLELATQPKTAREISLKGVDRESLLIAWLNELLHYHDSEGLGFNRFEILELDHTNLKARIVGGKIVQWLKDIKAATYHNLAITPTETGFEVTIVLDV